MVIALKRHEVLDSVSLSDRSIIQKRNLSKVTFKVGGRVSKGKIVSSDTKDNQMNVF